jgi:hypothetical protein
MPDNSLSRLTRNQARAQFGLISGTCALIWKKYWPSRAIGRQFHCMVLPELRFKFWHCFRIDGGR